MGEQPPVASRQAQTLWRELRAEGIVWEGRALIRGDENDLAVRLIVTQQRLAFMRDDAVVLDVERDWLRPAPTLGLDGMVLLQITPHGARVPEPLRLIIPEGRAAATRLVMLLTEPRPHQPRTPSAAVTPEPARDLLVPTRSDRAPVRKRAALERAASDWETSVTLPSLTELHLDDFPPVGSVERSNPADHPSSSIITGRLARHESHRDQSGTEPLLAPIHTTNGMSRTPDWSLQPLPGIAPRAERHRRVWIIRLGGLVVLLALAGAFAIGRLPHIPAIPGTEPAGDRSTPTREVAASLAKSPTPESSRKATSTPTIMPTVTSAPKRPTPPPSETALALGVGGESPTHTSPPEPAATASPTPTIAPSFTPTAEATATATASAPTATPSPTPTEAPSPSPTATSTPPATPSPTATPAATPTATPTVAPSPAPTSVVRAQRASVRQGETPKQTLVSGQFRYTIEAAFRGAELPELALASPGYGEWVVLVVYAENWSAENATLNVPEFRIAPSGAPDAAVPPDVATASVSQFLGFSPAYDANDRILFAPGEGHRLALVFLVSPDSGSLTLWVGDQALDLGPALAQPNAVASLEAAPLIPDMIEGTVVEVLDGRTIKVAVGGERVTVRYLGVEVPTDNACYAAEATAANADLVLGQTVWLERERKNRFSDEVYARDVWLERDGVRVLVARELAAIGAAVPAPAEPDTRYAGWIAAAGAAAQATGQGLWGACGGLAPVS